MCFESIAAVSTWPCICLEASGLSFVVAILYIDCDESFVPVGEYPLKHPLIEFQLGEIDKCRLP
jgi:hypothetical protein